MVRLDLQRVNAEAPYKVMPTVREGYFRFTTDFGVDYIIGFSQEELLDYEETYQFAIINANHQKSPRDRKLRDTVVAFVYEFFAQSDRVMLYFCETGDERQSLRSSLLLVFLSFSLPVSASRPQRPDGCVLPLSFVPLIP